MVAKGAVQVALEVIRARPEDEAGGFGPGLNEKFEE
jgi:hypothetical protein